MWLAAYHTATRLNDGRVMVAGGYDYYGAGWLSSCEIYNPVTGVWTTTGSLNTARYQHTATLLNDGRVLVAAGYASNGALKTAELFDPVQGTWTYTNGELITARQNHTATRLNDGRVVVAGGTGGFVGDPTNKGEFFNPSSGTWTATGNLKVGRRGGHTATLLADGEVMVAGGLTQVGDVLDYLNSVETMNSTGVWSLIDPMKNVRAGHRATRLLNDKVLVTGGSQSGVLT
ncbi:MAG: hypothetical protein FJ121_07775 [Deltaproteobacteria bacterium]|nr:hypothetical protein [Deltaproteobacteria bacterium]